eukprot:1666201-Prymnesium_polylepis.1
MSRTRCCMVGTVLGKSSRRDGVCYDHRKHQQTQGTLCRGRGGYAHQHPHHSTGTLSAHTSSGSNQPERSVYATDPWASHASLSATLSVALSKSAFDAWQSSLEKRSGSDEHHLESSL